MMSQRKAREVALQVLFQRGFHNDDDAETIFFAFADNFKFEAETRDYAFFLVSSIMELEEKIDVEIMKYSHNWRLDRIALIDQILLRIGIFELCFSTKTSTAPKLCITDVIDLSKKYSSEESKSFINGILDQVYNLNHP